MLSDCEKCWESPCRCGWDYRHMTRLDRARQAAAVLGIGTYSPEFDKLFEITPLKHPKEST